MLKYSLAQSLLVFIFSVQQIAVMTQPASNKPTAQKPAAGGIRLVRGFKKPEAASPDGKMARLSLDGANSGKPAAAAAAAAPVLTAEQQWNKVLEAHGSDREAAAAALVQQLAACDPSAPSAVAGLIKAAGAGALLDYGLLDRIQQGLTSEDAMPLDRASALHAYAALCKEAGRGVEPFLLPLLPAVLDRCADRVGAERGLYEDGGLLCRGGALGSVAARARVSGHGPGFSLGCSCSCYILG